MGYDYAGSTSSDITVTSTAIAMVMNFPIAVTLTNAGKEALVKKLIKDPDFPALEAAVKATLAGNKGLFDAANTDLFTKAADLLEKNVSNAKLPGKKLDAVRFSQDGTNLAFYRDRNRTVTSVVGLYKDGNKVHEIVVEGNTIFAESVEDVVNKFLEAIDDSNPEAPEHYKLTGTGNWEIVARTGRPDDSDGSDEFKKAFILNMQKIAFSLLGGIDPKLKMDDKQCFLAMGEKIYDVYKLYIEEDKSVAFTIPTIMKLVLKGAKEYEHCFFENTDNYDKYFGLLGDFFDLVDKVFIPGKVANTTLLGIQWSLIRPRFDTCYTVAEDQVYACASYGTMTANIDGVNWTGFMEPVFSWGWGRISLSALGGDPFVLISFEVGKALGTVPNSSIMLKNGFTEPIYSKSSVVKVTEFTDTHVKGTFEGTFTGDGGKVINVTDGTFETPIGE